MDLINWFPGHMAKAFKFIRETQAITDCFIVVLDARVPLSSYNDAFDQIAPHKPRLFVFSRADRIVPEHLKPFLARFNHPADQTVVVNLKHPGARTKILRALMQILAGKRAVDSQRGLHQPRLRCLVVGMPNVGKSTLINLIAQASKTTVANQAGTTRISQWIRAEHIHLLDTPGLLMPKLTNQSAALKLVACNLIRAEVISDQQFYEQVSALLAQVAPTKLMELGLVYSPQPSELYDQLVRYARHHHILTRNNQPDLARALALIRQKFLNLSGIIWDQLDNT